MTEDVWTTGIARYRTSTGRWTGAEFLFSDTRKEVRLRNFVPFVAESMQEARLKCQAILTRQGW